jgi:hypothetical protein
MAGLRQKAMTILADPASHVIHARSLAYVAIQIAAIDEGPSKLRWAETMFNQAFNSNRRRIRTAAVNKAYEYRDTHRRRPRKKPVEVADMNKIFGERPARIE